MPGVMVSILFSNVCTCRVGWRGRLDTVARAGIRPGDEVTLLWCLAPLAIAALFIDMRLLGRLAWWISERIPLYEKQDEE